MKIASWNVNSVKVRLPHLLAFLEDAQPDVLCLQETKCLADEFPRLEIAALGYRVETLGQRAYNGVALVSRAPARDIVARENEIVRVPLVIKAQPVLKPGTAAARHGDAQKGAVGRFLRLQHGNAARRAVGYDDGALVPDFRHRL